MSPRALVRLAHDLQGRSAATVDAELQQRQLSAEERIALRHEMAAAAQRQTLMAKLATDDAEYSLDRQPANETQRLLVRAGFKLGQVYRNADVNQLLETSGFDATQRIACRLELRELSMGTAAADELRPIFNIRASAERPKGTRLRDTSGQPVTLRSRL